MGQAQRNKRMLQEKLYRMGNSRYYDEGCWVGALNAAVIMLYVLHNDFGYGSARLKRVYNRIADLTNTYMKEGETERIMVKELAEVLEDECGIKLDISTATMRFPRIEDEPGSEEFRLK